MGSSDKHKAYGALGVVSFFWGTTWFVSKLTVQYLPALQLTAIRNIIAGLLLIIYFMRSEIKLPSAKEFGYLFLSGFLLIACSNGLTTIAIKFIPSFLGALISCLSPFVFVLANFIFFKEKTNARVILGLVIGFSGIALLLTSFRQEMSDPNFALGIALSLLAVITWPMGTLLTLNNKFSLSPYQSLGWQALFGGIILAISSYATGQYIPIASIPNQAWVGCFYLIIAGSILSFLCYMYALQKLPLSLVTIYVYVNPLVALSLGILLLDEKVNGTIVLGACITLLGIYIVKKFSKKNLAKSS